MHKPHVRRQMPVTATVAPTANGVSGGETASTGVNPGSSLLLGASGSSTHSFSDPLATDPGVASTPSPTPSASSSSSSNNSSASVSTGSVIAITVSAFLVLVGAMFLIYTYFKRRTAPRARHPRSRGPQSTARGSEILRDPGKDKQRYNGEGKNNSPLGLLNTTGGRAKSPDSAKLSLFKRDPSIRSVTDEKAYMSSSDDHHFDPSTMASFAKYQVGPTDDFSALPHPHPLASHEGGSPPVSWDGRTVISDPLASLHASVSDTMSPTAVVVRQTPLTMDSLQHRWESAEVLMMDGATSGTTSVYSDVSQNPFNDDASPRRSTGSKESARRSNSNPFFNASQHIPFSERSTRSRASSFSTTTAKRSRSYSASSSGTVRASAAAAVAAAGGGPESENALVSLLAALHPTPVASDERASDEQNPRSSLQTTLTSLYTPAEGGADRGTPQAF
jgi:hypothetical protein